MYLFDNTDIQSFCVDHKIPTYRIKQINQAIFTDSIYDIDAISTLPKELRELLKEHFVINTLTTESIQETAETSKFLFTTTDGHAIETMVMYHRHEKTPTEQNRKLLRSRTNQSISPETHILNRITICVSTQVGCAVGCIFCVTGKLGFKKNLSRAEILMQLILVNAHVKQKFGKKEDGTRHRIRNVVFMGMGEPLLNYENTTKSIAYMLAQDGFGLSKRHITISTSGVARYITKLIEDKIDCRLALSLHAPNQPLREQLIPMIAKKRPLEELLACVDAYEQATGNRVFYEYIMIDGLTDTTELAHQLGKLLGKRNAHLNLIPYNENPAMPHLSSSSFDAIIAFKKILEGYAIPVTVRDTLGRSVQGACGQLGYEKIREHQKEL